MKWAQVHLLRHFIQIGLIPEVLIDIANRFFYFFVVCHMSKIAACPTCKNPILAVNEENVHVKLSCRLENLHVETLIGFIPR